MGIASESNRMGIASESNRMGIASASEWEEAVLTRGSGAPLVPIHPASFERRYIWPALSQREGMQAFSFFTDRVRWRVLDRKATELHVHAYELQSALSTAGVQRRRLSQILSLSAAQFKSSLSTEDLPVR
jgi:hypothetical protein